MSVLHPVWINLDSRVEHTHPIPVSRRDSTSVVCRVERHRHIPGLPAQTYLPLLRARQHTHRPCYKRNHLHPKIRSIRRSRIISIESHESPNAKEAIEPKDPHSPPRTVVPWHAIGAREATSLSSRMGAAAAAARHATTAREAERTRRSRLHRTLASSDQRGPRPGPAALAGHSPRQPTLSSNGPPSKNRGAPFLVPAAAAAAAAVPGTGRYASGCSVAAHAAIPNHESQPPSCAGLAASP